MRGVRAGTGHSLDMTGAWRQGQGWPHLSARSSGHAQSGGNTPFHPHLQAAHENLLGTLNKWFVASAAALTQMR